MRLRLSKTSHASELGAALLLAGNPCADELCHTSPQHAEELLDFNVPQPQNFKVNEPTFRHMQKNIADDMDKSTRFQDFFRDLTKEQVEQLTGAEQLRVKACEIYNNFFVMAKIVESFDVSLHDLHMSLKASECVDSLSDQKNKLVELFYTGSNLIGKFLLELRQYYADDHRLGRVVAPFKLSVDVFRIPHPEEGPQDIVRVLPVFRFVATELKEKSDQMLDILNDAYNQIEMSDEFQNKMVEYMRKTTEYENEVAMSEASAAAGEGERVVQLAKPEKPYVLPAKTRILAKCVTNMRSMAALMLNTINSVETQLDLLFQEPISPPDGKRVLAEYISRIFESCDDCNGCVSY